MPSQYDHVRLSADAAGTAEVPASVPPGVYRVVGTDGERVTLLRVGDADGSRAVTGELYRVALDAYATAFDPAANPDDGIAPLRSARSTLAGWYHLLGNLLRRLRR